MDAPHNVTADMFNQLVDGWLKTNANEIGLRVIHTCSPPKDGQNYMCLCSETEKKYACKKCGTDIVYRRSFLSVHQAGWSHCAGTGEVMNPTLPCCPVCEPKPNIFGCIHEDDPQPSWINLPKQPTENVGFWASLGKRLKDAILPETWDT